MWEALSLLASCLQVCLLGWAVYTCLRIRAWVRSLITMDVDELLEQLVSDEAAQQATGTVACRTDSDVAQKREQLGAVIAGGQAERYLGRAISLDQIDKLPDSEILKLCARYEMCFGASIAKTLGHYVLAMYSDLAAYYRPKINPSSLTADLESNPLVEHGLSAYSGSLYHRFGMCLTPIAVALTTIKHCRFGEDTHDGNVGSDGSCGEQPSAIGDAVGTPG